MKDFDEFFIQKAIRCSLRDYSRIDALVIEKFVKNTNLSSLAEREALKKIKAKIFK